jgi:competence protein ComEC
MAGDFVAVRARLMPPPEPVRPGGYDFARDAFFRGIGGVGSALGAFEKAAPKTFADLSLRFNAAIDRGRNELTERIAGVIGGQAGALAAALVTGKRDLLSESTNDALRAAGVYHIVSVSGLHMVLAAGIFFFLARFALALLLEQQSRVPIKKIAAVVAMAGAAGYCLFTGSEVATERSLIMILVLLGAILVDRTPLSMRNLALAAIIVLLVQPETVIGPSFQMSFAAVAGLIAYAEWARARQQNPDDLGAAPLPLRWIGRLLQAFKLILITTVVASLATAPFAAYHFQRLNPLGIIGNALSLPIVGVVVMPAATLGVVAYPFGLDRYVWQNMGFGVEPILSVSAWVAGLRGSVTHAPAFGTAALALLSISIFWFVIWRTPVRLAALAPLLLGVGLAAYPERPDMLVARNGTGAALRAADGRLIIVGRPSRFDIDDWLRSDGDARRSDDASLRKAVACDAEACVARRPDGSAISVVRRASALSEDCRRAAILVTPLRAPEHCRPAILIDRDRLARDGALALIVAGDRQFWRTARGGARRRPWEPASAAPSPADRPPPAMPSSRSAPQDQPSDDAPIEP